MTAIAIATVVSVLGWKVLDVWNERKAVEVEGVVALTLRMDEADDAQDALRSEVATRLEVLEEQVEGYELERVSRG